MRFYDRPFLVLLGIVVVQGHVFSEVDALIQKPKVLSRPHNKKTTAANNIRQSSQQSQSPQSAHPGLSRPRMNDGDKNSNNNNRQQSSKSVLTAAHGGDAGSIDDKFQPKTSPASRLLTVTMLAVVLRKTKRGAALLQYSGQFLMNVLLKPYQNSLVNNPLITKVITGAVLAMVGDAVAQATSDVELYDKRRALSFAAFDSCYRVFQHNMFPAIIRAGQGNVMNNILPRIFPSSFVAMLAPAAAAIEQTAMYQFLIVPFVYYPVFFAFTGFIQGLSVRDSVDRMRSQFFPCWKRNLMFWIPTQMVLFGLVAEKWQIPFACLMGMIWSTILSQYAGSTKKK